MNRSRRNWRRALLVAALTMPLLASSCIEIATRSTINGFFSAVTPILDEQFEQHLADKFAETEQP